MDNSDPERLTLNNLYITLHFDALHLYVFMYIFIHTCTGSEQIKELVIMNINEKSKFSGLTNIQRAEAISMLTTAATNGITGLALSNIAERYIWNAYQVCEPITGLIGLCYRAEQAAKALS